MKVVLIILGILAALYVLLFLVFFFDLDGKLLFHVVEPWLDKRFSKMERKDPLSADYSTEKPDYKYKV